MNLGRPIVTIGDFVAQLCKSDALFPNDFGRICFSYHSTLTWSDAVHLLQIFRLLVQLEIRSVERGICFIDKSTIKSYNL